ncbi:stage II sporulation protein P [Clostridium sp. BJN0001]|uniref:stage II sporulation protein P n=1 Tax=Clostridium sp. BJN0001 TaxID=2930219 RepID=UPI001FD209BD|nr:stage II sporulation protein P [Clostridium sp. BJN0001]
MKRGTSKENFFKEFIFIAVIFLITIKMFSAIKSEMKENGIYYTNLIKLENPYLIDKEDGKKIIPKKILMKFAGISDLSYRDITCGEMSILNVPLLKNGEYDEFEINDSSISKFEKNTSDEKTDNTNIYDSSLKKELQKSNVEVLVYHTHTHENYSESQTDSQNEETNVVGVGDVLCDELENNYGIATIHDKTDHCVSYNGCYTRSGETVDKYIKKYNTFKMIIDLHRDSIKNKSACTFSVFGQNAAKVMFVNSENSSRYQKNREFTELLNKKAEELFPGISRGILTYHHGIDAFHQGKNDGAALFELGSIMNTPDEAKLTAKCLARVIAEVLNKK